jgi:hypothetical protein
MKDETVGQTLQRLAKESLPRYEPVQDRHNQRCECGEVLTAHAATRHKRRVCETCAAVMPRLQSGRRPQHRCCGCDVITPRLKMKMKAGNFYCKKCLKAKFGIDF